MKKTAIAKHIDDLVPYEKNAKIHSPDQIQKIAASIKEFGFRMPIGIDKNNIIVFGHGRVEAAKLLGYTEVRIGANQAKVKEKFIPCIYIDDLNEKQIRALRLAENKLAEAPFDELLLTEELNFLGVEMSSLAGFEVNDEIGALEEGEEKPEGDKTKVGNYYTDNSDQMTGAQVNTVKLIQLFFDEGRLKEFNDLVDHYKELLKTDNVTDTVFLALKHAKNILKNKAE